LGGIPKTKVITWQFCVMYPNTTKYYSLIWITQYLIQRWYTQIYTEKDNRNWLWNGTWKTKPRNSSRGITLPPVHSTNLTFMRWNISCFITNYDKVFRVIIHLQFFHVPFHSQFRLSFSVYICVYHLCIRYWVIQMRL
jgi:hypothetical protein